MENQQKPIVKAVAAINSMKAMEIADNESVRDKFIQIFESVHGKRVGSQIYDVEKFHFQKQMVEKPELQECTQMSIYGAFIDLAAQGLSVDPSKKLAYLLFDNCNAGTKESPRWEKRARLQISGRGELAIRQAQGQIMRADNPVIIYEGDHFRKYVDQTGKLIIEYEAAFPAKSTKILGAFIRILLPDGQTDYKHLDEVKIESLKAASAKKNKGYANALYTSVNGGIDPGFLEAKVIKHAFTSYPKVNLRGNFVKLETEILDEIENDINYELDAPKQPFNPEIGEIHKTEATIQMTEQPSEPGTPVTVNSPDFDNF